MLDMNPESQKVSGFKLANFGTTSPKFFGNTKICAKQAYYIKSVDVRTSTGMCKVECKIPYDLKRQAKELTKELNCLVWARALLALVYRFMDMQMDKFGKPDFAIPQMCFVEGALVVEQQGNHRVFLIEEIVNVTKEGSFQKYLNNDSAIPLFHRAEADATCTDFLSFTQHVQYWKTKKLAFVTDYQGALIVFLVGFLLTWLVF
jgi:Alpha-kinase family